MAEQSPSSPLDGLLELTVKNMHRALSIERLALAAARNALRDAEEFLPLAKARAVNVLVLSHAGDEKQLGANAEARERSIALYLESDMGYLNARGDVRQARQQVEQHDLAIADLEAALKLRGYERAEQERVSRDRMSDALLQIGTSSSITLAGLDGIAAAIKELSQSTAAGSGRV